MKSTIYLTTVMAFPYILTMATALIVESTLTLLLIMPAMLATIAYYKFFCPFKNTVSPVEQRMIKLNPTLKATWTLVALTLLGFGLTPIWPAFYIASILIVSILFYQQYNIWNVD